MTMIQPLPRFARLLGLSGLLPQMLCLALALADPGVAALAGAGLAGAGLAGLFYAALILSFLGGLWWMAAALGGVVRPGPYLLAVLPSLVGWAILLAQGLGLLALPACLALLALCLLASPLADRHLARSLPVPPGWIALRWAMASGLGGLTLLLSLTTLH
ncbi:MAG: DUF3429 family protein [Gemmobacter sp.]|nr:DUF3429 family protein [Gemmobacter sp.]